MGKVIYPRKGEVHTAPVTLAENFADNTWVQIIEACETNTVPDTWVVGDQKAMTINGVDYMVDIIGKNHDTYTSGGTAPLTFQMHDFYRAITTKMNETATNKGGWTDCYMRNTVLPTILLRLPSEVQAGIKEVNKQTSSGNLSSTINTTADKLFLLSEIEVFGKNSGSKSGEGVQYLYYSSGNSTVKTVNGSAVNWWLRSPYAANSIMFLIVYSTGTWNTSEAHVTSNYTSFAFCF